MHPFRLTPLHWIAGLEIGGRLATAPRPRGGDWLPDEIDGWRAGGADRVISLLEPEEVECYGLQREGDCCRANGIQFTHFPIEDVGVPEFAAAAELIDAVTAEVRGGRSVVFHCRAGIGRSSTMAAAALTCFGIGADEAFARISEARGLQVPDTDEQIDWVRRFSEFGLP